MLKTFNKKNKFKENPRSISLTKVNPYYENKAHYLPYKYTDPSFKSKYKGPLMQKDLYMLNLMNNRINNKRHLSNYNNKYESKSQVCQKLTPNVAITTEIIFNSAELEKKSAMEDYYNYINNLLKKRHFKFNPVKNKDEFIKYREYLYKDIPTYKGKPRRINNHYLKLFEKEMREQAYKNWKQIENEYKRKEYSEDKFIKTDYSDNHKYNIFHIKNRFNNKKKKIYIKANI